MINDNTILSSFNDRPTLLEWLKKVEEALKSDTATGVSVENPSVNSYIFKITFADGKTIASDTIRFPDSVKGVSILNNHLILTMQSGLTDDLGVINPYAETIVSNSETNTTEIRNNAVLDGNLQVNGNVLFGSSIISIQGTTKQNGILGTNADGQIAFKEISGGDNTLVIFASSNVGQTGDYEFYADTTISDDSIAKLINGDIKVISGTFAYKNGNIGYFSTSYCGNKSEYGEIYNIYEGVNVNSSTNKLEKFSIKYNTTSHPNSISLRYVQYALTRG